MPEEHQRIEEQERKRAAEEKYGAEVRAGLDRPMLTEVRKWTRFLRIFLAVVLAATILAVLIINALMSNRSTNQTQRGVPSSSGVR